MVFRAFTTLAVALGLLLTHSTCSAQLSAPNNMLGIQQPWTNQQPPKEPIVVIRAIINHGNTTPHRTCTEEDFRKIEAAISEVSIVPGISRRLGGRKERMLSRGNCARLCEGLTRVTCLTNYGSRCESWTQSNCTPICDRRLQEPMVDSSMVIMDDVFDDQPSVPPAVGGIASGDLLTTQPPAGSTTPSSTQYATTYSNQFTLDQCNEGKAKLFQKALSVLGNVAIECANLLLSENTLQCLVLIDDD